MKLELLKDGCLLMLIGMGSVFIFIQIIKLKFNYIKEIIMSKNDKNKKEIHTSEGNDIMFPLLFGIIATVLMAAISHFIGK